MPLQKLRELTSAARTLSNPEAKLIDKKKARTSLENRVGPCEEQSTNETLAFVADLMATHEAFRLYSTNLDLNKKDQQAVEKRRILSSATQEALQDNATFTQMMSAVPQTNLYAAAIALQNI